MIKEIKASDRVGKAEVKLSLIVDDMTTYVKKPKTLSKNFLKQTSDSSKVAALITRLIYKSQSFSYIGARNTQDWKFKTQCVTPNQILRYKSNKICIRYKGTKLQNFDE